MKKRFQFDLSYEKRAWAQDKLLVACDEAGTGSAAGNFYVCAVAFPRGFEIPETLHGVKDSKQIKDPRERAALASEIKQSAEYYTSVEITPGDMLIQSPFWLRFDPIADRIEKDKFLWGRAITLMDGDTSLRSTKFENTHLVKADLLCFSVAAASILAKNMKDVEMKSIHEKYPHYGFDAHSGYLTAVHIEALKKYGGIPNIHRNNYIQKIVKKDS